MRFKFKGKEKPKEVKVEKETITNKDSGDKTSTI